MQIVIDIPDEQIKKCLEESKYIHEDEGEKGGVHIVLLYTNQKLEFVDISRKTDFYSLTDRYTVLPKGHGRLIDADAFIAMMEDASKRQKYKELLINDCLTVDDVFKAIIESLLNKGLAEGDAPTIIEANTESEEKRV